MTGPRSPARLRDRFDGFDEWLVARRRLDDCRRCGLDEGRFRFDERLRLRFDEASAVRARHARRFRLETRRRLGFDVRPDVPVRRRLELRFGNAGGSGSTNAGMPWFDVKGALVELESNVCRSGSATTAAFRCMDDRPAAGRGSTQVYRCRRTRAREPAGAGVAELVGPMPRPHPTVSTGCAHSVPARTSAARPVASLRDRRARHAPRASASDSGRSRRRRPSDRIHRVPPMMSASSCGPGRTGASPPTSSSGRC